MKPILFSIGSIDIYSFSVFLIFSWLTFSFLFWRELKNQAVSDQKIFDLTFVATIFSFAVSRLSFVIFHWENFSDNLLKILTLWVSPGYTLFGAIFGMLFTFLYLKNKVKVLLSDILDSFAISFSVAFIIGSIGALLDGTRVGKLFDSPISVEYVGHIGGRHPVQLYEIAFMFLIFIFILFIQKQEYKGKLPRASVSIWFFILFSIMLFITEFFKESTFYWVGLTINQWISLAFFSEGIGALIIRHNGVRYIKLLLRSNNINFIRIIKGGYDGIRSKIPGKNQE